MPNRTPRPYRKLLVLGVLVAALYAIQESAPRGYAQGCSLETYDYCDQFGLWVNPMTCGCAAYCPLLHADCQMVGKTLDYDNCQCVGAGWLEPIGMCDSDPYALGCPRSFDTVFGGVTPGYGWGLCPSGAGSNCASIGGSYNYNTCTCTIATQTGFCSASMQNACTSAGGTVNTQNCTCRLP